MLDKMMNGDIAGMLDDIAQVFSFAWANFTNALFPAPAATEALSQTGEAAFSMPALPELTGVVSIVALAWVAFALITHTALWKRLTSWQMPTWASVAIGAPLMLFAVASAIAFASHLAAGVWLGGALTVLAVLAALPVLACLGMALERLATVLHR